MSVLVPLLHHSESIDPELIDWIRHEIDSILGLEPVAIVAALGVVIVAFPLALLLLARRQRGTQRRNELRRRRVLYRDSKEMKEPMR